MQNVNTLCIAAQSPQDTHSTYGIVQRTESDWAANGIRLDGGRNPMAEGALSGGTLRGCTCLKCTNQADGERVPTEHAEHTEPSGRESLPQIGTDAHRLGGYGIPAIPTPPTTQPNHLWKPVKSVGEYYHAHKQADGERMSHRTRGTHRTFWQRKPPTDRHRCAQIRRVWHPCHTHAANNAA